METEKFFLLRIVTENKSLKLLALVLAVITWYAIQGVINFEIDLIDVPLRIELDKGWAVLDRTADEVDILFKGSQEDLLRLNRDYVEVLLDLRGDDIRGVTELTITPDMVRVPAGIRIVDIRPNRISISLDQEGAKTVPVKVEMKGTMPDGYEVEKVVCTPAAVVVKGPLQRISEIERVRTVPLVLDNRHFSFDERLALASPSEHWTAQMEPEKVKVEVTVNAHTATRLISGVDVHALIKSNYGAGLSIAPARVDVTLKGREEALARLSAKELNAYVECAGLEPAARYELPVRVDVPPDVAVSSIEPSTVNVTLDVR
ncbi:MAG: hypothetical protein EOM20_05905 [Spartobacteria bacterium]|nr:hypothetical protein [Spartobacteria bacterium]